MIAWLLDTLFYTALLIALVLLLRRPVGRWFGPQLAYALWALPMLRLVLPPIELPAQFAPAPPPTTFESTAPVAELPLAALPAAAAPAWNWADVIAPVLSVWAGVALAFLVWRIVTYRQMRRELLSGARPVGDIGPVRLVETPVLATPVAFGVFDKVIALPAGYMAQHDRTARDLAIAHELAHHRGHDLLANMAAQALLALHWCNPLAWLGWRAMRRDQEAACDARVLAGRGRDDRVRYANLIAGVAAGPSLALAAPMACPVLGERSIIHRLRSLSMPETSRRRRWLGRGLVTAGALALPLTASISYAAVQAPEAPPAPDAPDAPLAPEAPDAPDAPDAPEAGERQVRTVVIHRDGEEGEPIVRRQVIRVPHAPRAPYVEWRDGTWDHEAFEREMERFGEEMERFQVEIDRNSPEWERMGEEMARVGEEHAARAIAMAEQARHAAPQVRVACRGDGAVTTRTEDGQQRIVICERNVHRLAGSSVRRAREAIAGNREMDEDVRREVLEDLDREIARLEREQG